MCPLSSAATTSSSWVSTPSCLMDTKSSSQTSRQDTPLPTAPVNAHHVSNATFGFFLLPLLLLLPLSCLYLVWILILVYDLPGVYPPLPCLASVFIVVMISTLGHESQTEAHVALSLLRGSDRGFWDRRGYAAMDGGWVCCVGSSWVRCRKQPIVDLAVEVCSLRFPPDFQPHGVL